MRSRERDIFNYSFEISLTLPVFSLSKHELQKSAVSTCLKGSNLPFNLPPPLTFVQGLRNRGLWFGTPHSALSLLSMIFTPFKIWVLMMDSFSPWILQWSSTFSWPQLYASPSLFCVMGAMLNFQSFTCNTRLCSKESKPQLAITTAWVSYTIQQSSHGLTLICFPCVRRGKWPDGFWVVWISDSQYQNVWWCPKESISQWEGPLAKYFWENNP